MTFRSLALGAATALVGAAGVAAADEPTVEELQRKLEERDKVILELLDRVEALERRVGLDGARVAEQAGSTATDTTPAATDDQAKASNDQGAASERAPGRVVVDEEAAERALERSLTQAGALLLRPGYVEVEPSFSYARDEDATPTFVSRGGRTFAGQRERNVDTITANLSARLGLPWESQLELGLPYRWRQAETSTNIGFSPTGTSTDSAGGLGDIRIGVAKTLLREGLWRPDVVGRLTWDTATGEDSEDNLSLGGGFHEVRGSLTAIKRQDPIAFVGGLSYEHAFENDDIQPGDTIGANVGGFIALSPETSLQFLLSGAYQGETEVADAEIDGSDQVLGTFVVGGSTLLSRGVLLNLSVGIGLTDDADDVSVALSLPIRFDSPIF